MSGILLMCLGSFRYPWRGHTSQERELIPGRGPELCSKKSADDGGMMLVSERRSFWCLRSV